MWQHKTPLELLSARPHANIQQSSNILLVISPIQVVGSEVCQDRLLHLFSQVQQQRHLGHSLWASKLLHSQAQGQQLAAPNAQPINALACSQQPVGAAPPHLPRTLMPFITSTLCSSAK